SSDLFIRDLPDGYDTVVGEQGLTLSGGQRQRVCLARALLTDPDILILDDATSAVDAQVEAEIHATLRKVMAGRTTLLVAHRRSTLALADRIVVLDAGRVVDSGTHEELQERCPLYRRLLSGDPADPVAAPVAPPGPARQPAPAAVPAGPYHRVGAVAVPGRIGGRGGGALTSQLAALPATPELLAQVRALPPARDTPGVDAVRVREPEPRFTLR